MFRVGPPGIYFRFTYVGVYKLRSWVDTLYTCWDIITHYETKSVDFGGLMNSATTCRRV